MSHLREKFERHPAWSELQKVSDTLNSHNHVAYLVGGCVRDGLIDRPLNDFDLATDARPEVIQELFDHTIDVGKDFGTIIVISGNEQFEITTFRKDGRYEDGRHPVNVEFSDAETDARRRDFTMNALFYDLQKDSVIDHVGGVADINRKIIRTVGDPKTRFDEDKLRMLRALRFSSQLGWGIEEQTKKAVYENIADLNSVSRERLQVEITKILTSWYPEKGLNSLLESGATKVIFNLDLEDLILYSKQTLPRFSAFKEKVPFSENVALTLFVFDLDSEQAELVLRSLKYSKKLVNDVLELKKWSTKEDINLSLSESRTLLAEPYREDLFVLIDVLWPPKAVKQLGDVFAKYGDKLPQPLISGMDLVEFGFEQGPEMGKVLDRFRKLQLDGVIETKSEALTKLRELKR